MKIIASPNVPNDNNSDVVVARGISRMRNLLTPLNHGATKYRSILSHSFYRLFYTLGRSSCYLTVAFMVA